MAKSMLQDVPANQPLKDTLLADAIGRTLQQSAYDRLRSVQIAVRGGCVLLVGCVPSYYLKQMAQCTAMKIPGVARLENRLEVL